MTRTESLSVTDFTGVYRDIAEIIGVDATIKLHKSFQGQQITFPKKLYSRDYIVAQVRGDANSSNIKSIASEFGYTERRLRQIMKEKKC